MKVYGVVHVQIQLFLTSALVGGELSASHPNCFITGERSPSTQRTRTWVGPRTSLDDVEGRKILSLLWLKRTVQTKNEESKMAPELDTLLNLGIWWWHWDMKEFLNGITVTNCKWWTLWILHNRALTRFARHRFKECHWWDETEWWLLAFMWIGNKD
jgi:hypothetical protein